jgi:hypothetical protein
MGVRLYGDQGQNSSSRDPARRAIAAVGRGRQQLYFPLEKPRQNGAGDFGSRPLFSAGAKGAEAAARDVRFCAHFTQMHQILHIDKLRGASVVGTLRELRPRSFLFHHLFP